MKKRSRSGVRQEVFLDVVAVGLEQHAGAAELANLLLRPLDHAVALAALGGHDFASGSHLEALFSARFGLQLGHLALLLPQHENAREGVRSAKMLVRALKMLNYFRNETIRMVIDTAALDQPGDEACAYGRGRPGWQRRSACGRWPGPPSRIRHRAIVRRRLTRRPVRWKSPGSRRDNG